jgi:uncharacterized protein YehS (DUF1456 family)
VNNNDVLRRIRYTFNYDDSRMIAIFGHGGLEVTRAEISDWLKKDDDPDYRTCQDVQLAAFRGPSLLPRLSMIRPFRKAASCTSWHVR